MFANGALLASGEPPRRQTNCSSRSMHSSSHSMHSSSQKYSPIVLHREPSPIVTSSQFSSNSSNYSSVSAPKHSHQHHYGTRQPPHGSQHASYGNQQHPFRTRPIETPHNYTPQTASFRPPNYACLPPTGSTASSQSTRNTRAITNRNDRWAFKQQQFRERRGLTTSPTHAARKFDKEMYVYHGPDSERLVLKSSNGRSRVSDTPF